QYGEPFRMKRFGRGIYGQRNKDEGMRESRIPGKAPERAGGWWNDEQLQNPEFSGESWFARRKLTL
ncbi:MAG: hypothetical protein K9M97_12825, partial [Akkermansiaceae bacterium]|nr:hypothetical protein [Akkermansiaceae bacterium]